MLGARLLSAAILIGTVLAFIWADATGFLGASAGTWLLPVYLAAVIGTAYEFARLLRVAIPPLEARPTALVAALAAVCSSAVVWLPAVGVRMPADCPIGLVGWGYLGVVAALIVFCFLAMRRYGRDRQSIAVPLAGQVLVVTYAIGLGHFLICLRLSPPELRGLLTLIGIIVIVKFCDSGAYFVGRFLGRHPMHSVISPKKTMEGAAGGLTVATLGGLVYFLFLVPAISGSDTPIEGAAEVLLCALGAFVVAMAGMTGDLVESLVKRSCAAKDSGTLLPGMGGVWDVTDSLLLAAPVAYAAQLAGCWG